MGTLNTVEFIGMLVNSGNGIKIRIGDIQPFSAHRDGSAQDNVAKEGTKACAKDDPAVFIGNSKSENHDGK